MMTKITTSTYGKHLPPSVLTLVMSTRRSRRETLQAGICLFSSTLAGCLTGTGTPTEPPEEPVSLAPGESFETADGWSLTVELVGVQIAVVRAGTVHSDPVYGDDEQYVVADVATDDGPDPADLNVFVRTDTQDRSNRRYVRADSNVADLRQRFGYAVPVSPAPSDGAVVWEPDDERGVRWELPADLLDQIARPPAFDLQGFEAEDAPGDEVEVTLTVANTGEGDGTFVAEVGDAEVSDQPEVFVDVPAGETVTVERRAWAAFVNDEVTVVVRWRGERLERTVDES